MKQNLSSIIEKGLECESVLANLKPTGHLELCAPLGVVAFLLKRYSQSYNCFYVAGNELEAEGIFESLGNIVHNALFFPAIDVIPYSNVIPSPDKLSDRMRTLYTLQNDESPHIVITNLEAYLRKIPPVEFFKKSLISFKVGDMIDRDETVQILSEMSYFREFKVSEPGSFSVRGDIIDIFPPNMTQAVRLSLFDNEVESIKLFNPLTQLSQDSLPTLTIIPANEFATRKEKPTSGEEEYLDDTRIHSYFMRFYRSSSQLLDYSRKPNLVIYHAHIHQQTASIAEKYRIQSEEKGEDNLLYRIDQVLNPTENRMTIMLHTEDKADCARLSFSNPPEFGEGFSRLVTDLESTYLANGYRVFIIVEYDDLSKRLSNILRQFNPKTIHFHDEVDDTSRLYIVVGNFEHGFLYQSEDNKILVLSESDLSGKKRLFRKRIRQIDTIFEDIEDIQEGETVVHLNYGIGIFKRIERINVLGKEKDYILIEYAEHEKLFVPLEQSNLIGKYVGGVTKKPVLDSLGGKSWAKKRERVQKSIEEFASRLVAIYAKRNMLSGHSFSVDTVWQREFDDQFEFIETPDQVKVIEEIKRDMENSRPMDRLLCGDVGFGKTEVAMRAAFKAAMDGKQVALIAPTTVLVEQHYNTFIERYRNFPVRIEYVSRFTHPQKWREVVKGLKEHKVDIIIGTHKLFSEKIVFHALGLVIVDEEHKFGVLHKENLKEKYPTVDFLSLSATPIPRTLNMAMSTIRDISLLQTPPDMRIPVATTISEFSEEVVRYAIKNELDRDGQVFFVHNTIKRLAEYAYMIEKMIPEARVTTGHGQMEEEELERAFMGFVRKEFNVFVCTTIIDSGLDIPNANTIIVSDSHRFGLSQLYQLKGRVGRGKREGYAYFFYPAERMITETAQKRLFVINEYTDLGAGFNIALKDLEIRGAGNILGKEQHGNIIAVGYDVYMRLLRQEIEKQKGEFKETVDTLIDLKYDAYIPESYIPDSPTKMEIYKKILSVASEDEIKTLSEELLDRFGHIPAEVSTLFEISRLKIKASAIGIETIMEKDRFIEISFSKFSKVDAVKVMGVKAAGKHEITIKPNEKNKLFYKSFDSNITLKVKRLTALINEIIEE